MLFNSIRFLCFFPIVVLVYYIVPQKLRYIWLLLSSYYFYMSWNPKYILLIFCSTVTTFLCGIVIEFIKNKKWDVRKEEKWKRICILTSVIINLGILGYFKYFNFFIYSMKRFLEKAHISIQLPVIDVLLPVGISFYTFQTISYIMDVYRNKVSAEKNFIRYALFVSFFPQLVAGPIERSENLLKQFHAHPPINYEQVREGLMLMLWGYFLKIVLADRIAIFVDAVYENYTIYNGWFLIIASILFAFQIYSDFAGYSIIALGAAKVLGFQMTDNFNAPYFSQSTAEFWRRWHISLFSWFQDYIYIPLGGSHKGKFRKFVNVEIVFLISGLWHGAAWHYVMWGGINGVYQIIGEILQPIRNKTVALLGLNRDLLSHKLYRVVSTFLFIDIAWVFFRTGVKQAFDILRSMFHPDNIWILFDKSLFSLGLDQTNFTIMFVAIILLIVMDYFKYKGIVIREVICRQEAWFRWSVLLIGICAVVILGVYGVGYDEVSFIYFQF